MEGRGASLLYILTKLLKKNNLFKKKRGSCFSAKRIYIEIKNLYNKKRMFTTPSTKHPKPKTS